MNTPDAVSTVCEVYDACSKLFPGGTHDAYLYCSYARGDFDSESDVYILLTIDADGMEISKHRNDLAEITSNLGLKHGVMVSVTVKPLQQFRQYSAVLPFHKNVLREGVRYTN